MGDKGEDDVSLRVSLKFFNSDMRLLVPFKIRWHVTLRVSLKFNISLIFIYIYIYGLLSKIKWRVTLRVSLKLVLRNPPRKPPTRYFTYRYNRRAYLYNRGYGYNRGLIGIIEGLIGIIGGPL